MLISPIRLFSSAQIQCRPQNVSFGGRTSCLELFNDIYEKSKEDSIVKVVNIKDLEGNPAKGVIYREELDEPTMYTYGKGTQGYTIRANGENAGFVIFTDNPDKRYIAIRNLKTDKKLYPKKYKGAGTELIKAVVEESIKRGYRGRITLLASYSPPPFVFYYKNNLRPAKEYEKYTPAIDYATRNNVDIQKLLPGVNSMTMELSEKGAKALLKGERLYETETPMDFEI